MIAWYVTANRVNTPFNCPLCYGARLYRKSRSLDRTLVCNMVSCGMNWTMRVVIFLVGSVILNTLVAWGCALWIRPPAIPLGDAPDQRLAAFVPTNWSAPLTTLEGSYRFRCYSSVVGINTASTVESARVQGWRELGGQISCGVVDYGVITVRESGWPLRCLECGESTTNKHLRFSLWMALIHHNGSFAGRLQARTAVGRWYAIRGCLFGQSLFLSCLTLPYTR